MEQSKLVDGLPLEQWEASFRPGMPEFAATTFTFTAESTGLVRIAFANGGPRLSESGPRKPVYTHAVTLPPEVAVDLAGLLLKFFAEPTDDRSSTSGQL